MITIQKIRVTARVCHQRTVQGVSKQNIIRAVSQPPATIREPRLLTDYTYQNQRILAGAVTRHQRRASQTPVGPWSNRESSSNHCHELWSCTQYM